MERMLKNFWIFSTLLAISAPVAAESWESVIRKISHNKKSLSLTSSLQQYPSYKVTPKIIAFSGVVKLPSQISLINGSSKVHANAGQIIIDNQVVCDYSPKSSKDRNYTLVGCSDGSQAGDDIIVNQKIVLKLNQAASDEAAVSASLKIVRADSISYGLQFPFLSAEEGNVLMFTDGAWVAANPTQIQGLRGEAGATGAQGPAGAPGPQGPQGEQGEAGVAGAAGAVGPQGPQGPKGATGEMGLNGLKGDKGDAGVAGAAGAQGPQGAAGPMGPQGLKGDKGDAGVAGAAGAQGPQGAAGPIGPQGLKGEKGDAGIAGVAGAQGPQGAAGPMGPQGPKGDTGAAGANGAEGPQGFAGPMGPQGPKGEVGDQGPKGDKGDRGLSEIAYMRDEKASGVHGGSCTAGKWNKRDLNVLGGDSSFIVLSNSNFILQPGKYFIEISAPAMNVQAHQTKLKVLETGLDVLIGSSAYSGTATVNHSIIQGEIIVSAVTTYEVQHRCSFERPTTGFGPAANFGTPEVYTQVKIIKKQ